ncbi:MAG: choice-of-anchor J domain-containing protein [Anaerolineae bacterium]
MKARVAARVAALLVVVLCLALPWSSGRPAASADTSVPRRDLDALLGSSPTPEAGGDADGRYFWVQAAEGGEGYVSRHFNLVGETKVFHVWAEDSTPVQPDLMVAAARELEANLRRGLIGSLWRATKARGIDAAPIDLVFAAMTGAGGYFTSVDQPGSYSHPYSNRANVIYVSEAACQLGVACAVALPAHELQHLLLYLIDPQEPSWMSEGLSEIAEVQTGGWEERRQQLECTDFPLLRWTDDGQSVGLYYAGAGDFLRFWASLYGRPALSAVAVSPMQGIAAFATYLSVHDIEATFDDAFMGWAAEQASLALAQQPLGEGIYPARGACATASLLTLPPGGSLGETVTPYGCDRIMVEGTEAATVEFSGEAATAAVPVAPHSGTSFWWSNRAGQSQTTLTRALDLRRVEAAHLSFWLWYDIEPSYDWGYVAVSTDDGATWHVVGSEDSTTDNPVGGAPGTGYTGASGGWRQQTVDLSEYAGQQVLLQFGYLTDDAVEYDGLAIDDVEVPEIGLADDMEAPGEWDARGFRLLDTERPLAQRYGASLVTGNADGYTSRPLPVTADGRSTWVLPALEAGEERAIVICGLTEAAAMPAPYQIVAR